MRRNSKIDLEGFYLGIFGGISLCIIAILIMYMGSIIGGLILFIAGISIILLGESDKYKKIKPKTGYLFTLISVCLLLLATILMIILMIVINLL